MEHPQCEGGSEDVTPAELHLLARPDLGGPAFFVRDGLLQRHPQQDLGQRVVAEAQALQQEGRLRAAGMNRGAGRWEDRSYRGDEMAWLLASGGAEAEAGAEVVVEVEGKKSDGGSGIPTLRIPKASAIHAAVARLERTARRLDALDRRGPGPPQLNLEAGLRKSVQLAYYPGDGHRYVRHRDAFPSTRDGGGEAIRCLTVICYLNADWQAKHGGRLRIFLPGGRGEAEPAAGAAPAAQWEVDPLLGRVVVFRSDVVEHEVLPAWAPRFALTCWFYGRPLHSVPRPVAAVERSGALVAAALALAGVDIGGEKGPAAAASASGAPRTAETDGAWTTTPPPLPIEEGGEGAAWAAETILVSVAAYRDSECQHTLHSLFAAARRPERVSVALVWQGDSSVDDARCFARPLDPRWARRVRTLRMDHREAAGPCWARHLAQALWKGERFLLQIDSHMRFRPNWDAYLVAALTRGGGLPDQGRRAVLTTYPVGYELLPPGAGAGGARVPTDVRPTLLCPSKFDAHGLLRQAARRCAAPSASPIPAAPLWASGFSFSWARPVLEACPYDPRLRHLFFGEEGSMAARLWTHGFDFYAPGETVLYHLWSRAHRPSFREGPPDPARAAAEEEAARGIVLRLLGMREEKQEGEGEEEALGSRYGLGTARSLAAYEELLGVDFKRGLFRSADALWCGRRPEFFDLEGPGSLLGAEEQPGACDGAAASKAKKTTAAVPSAAAAGVLGTQNLQKLVGSFLK